ncbi:MAG: hypothetical protein SGPRY_011334, partial [Prymnesium sp.]
DPKAGSHRAARRWRVLPWWLPGGLGGIDSIDGTDPLLRAPSTQLIDVRWEFEFNKERFADAQLCPLLPSMHTFQQRVRALNLSPSAPTVVICQHAIRSPPAVKKLRAMGFSDVRQLRGGMAQWLNVEGVSIERGCAG